MTTQATATAFSKVAKDMPSGLLSKAATYTYAGATITASANALHVNMLKVPHGAQITDVVYECSTGAATCLVDIGLEVTSGATNLSAIASQLTAGVVHQVSPLASNLPYLISCPDTQVTRFAKVILGATPGTATSAIELAINVTYTMDGNA